MTFDQWFEETGRFLLAGSSFKDAMEGAFTAGSPAASLLTPREITALRELKDLGGHRHFAVRNVVAEAWPIVERLALASMGGDPK